ncbi:hypothetical protein KVR01_005842 [Diaporthe batatas]|uniref:uncharacterized protein n=1 Tax=Diaporthe batatas TaxID=748121 RepID=UPI001D05585F|nr:uncharacterized protein KVR01_005842 [Diaporthe batatas]KAG8163924.1 hypothetical protein KVR01_005842 [Diaporthe batatas]
MATASSPSRIVSKEDLDAEIKSRSSALEFSKRGPNCRGCFEIFLKTVCGHVYTVRERCQPKGLVCAGSELLIVHWDDLTLDLGKGKCQTCLRIHKYQANHSESLSKQYASRFRFKPTKIAAKKRMEAVKEQWLRECVEQNIPVSGLTRAQADALAAEKDKVKAEVSPSSSKEDSKPSQLVIPDFSDFVGDHPGMLHDPNLETEWTKRSKCLVEKVGGVSRAETNPDVPQIPIDDPSPAFIFRSPFLSKSPTNQAHVETEDQTSSETKCS